MVLLIDPYANVYLSMADIRLMNKVAGAITNAYRLGMRAQALRMHIERDFRLDARRR
jgi:hypothetical protein